MATSRKNERDQTLLHISVSRRLWDRADDLSESKHVLENSTSLSDKITEAEPGTNFGIGSRQARDKDR